jgi:GT2 family glycosyltransferase
MAHTRRRKTARPKPVRAQLGDAQAGWLAALFNWRPFGRQRGANPSNLLLTADITPTDLPAAQPPALSPVTAAVFGTPCAPAARIVVGYATAEAAPGSALLQASIVLPLPSGTVIAGWLSDPRGAVARVTVQRAPREPGWEPEGALGPIGACDVEADSIDLAAVPRLASLLPPGLGGPGGAPGRFGFVAWLAAQAAKGPARAALQLHDGSVLREILPPTGDATTLTDSICEAAPVEALGVVQYLLAGHRAAAPGTHTPPDLDRLGEAVFDAIETDTKRVAGTAFPAAVCYLDSVLRVGRAGILIKGWLLLAPGEELASITLVSLAGQRAAMPLPLTRLARPDVIAQGAFAGYTRDSNSGFVAYAPIEPLRADDRRWMVEISLASGALRRTPFVCGPAPAPMAAIQTVVALAEPGTADFNDLFRRAISPPLDWFWSQLQASRPAPTVRDYGEPPRGAPVSIIVPLYGRIDLMRHQIVSFSNDPDFRARSGAIELIYVLDDPNAERDVGLTCRLLHDTYGVPFRMVLQHGNFGYSAANNAGARAATGRQLLLLNSDVMPKRPRWATHLARLYGTLDACGALGCRLLFEDGSLQHAGMSFRPSLMLAGSWSNEHGFKGLSVAFDPHAQTEAVAAVTGACLMIDRTLYGELGGLNESYVIGDFEDSDLCLRVHERGRKVYYTPDVELYHLERQSMKRIGEGKADWRQSLTLFNMWKHTERWKTLIPAICARYEGACSVRPDIPAPVSTAPAMPDQPHRLRAFEALRGGHEIPALPAASFPARSHFVMFPAASPSLTPWPSTDCHIDVPRASLFGFDKVTLHGFRLFDHGGQLFNDYSLVDPTGAASLEFWRKFADGQNEDVFLGTDGMPTAANAEEFDASGCLILSSDEPANFGSWIYRFLAKYLVARAHSPVRRVFAYDDGRWMRPVLELVDPSVEIVAQDIKRPYRLRNALIPSLPAPHVFLRPELIAGLGEIADKVGVIGSLPARIYVSRRKQALTNPGMRVLENETELVEKLSSFGFAEFFPEDHAVHTQIAVFSNARAIISPGGSNLFCAAFARRAEFILDIESSDTWLYAHMNLLASTARPFSTVLGQRTGRGGAVHGNWTVDVGALIEGLRGLGVV